MADESDVETALVTLCSAALYPNGTNSPSAPGPDCRIYRGWPNSAALDADLTAGRINVSVFPVPRHARTTTRYTQARSGIRAQPVLTASVSGTSVTFGGTADLGQVAGVLVDGQSYAYRTRSGDNPARASRREFGDSRAGQRDCPIVGVHTHFPGYWQAGSASCCGRFGPTGSPATGADLSCHLLVSHTNITRRSGYRYRSCSRPVCVYLSRRWIDGQGALCRDDNIRSIAGRSGFIAATCYIRLNIQLSLALHNQQCCSVNWR